MESDVEQENWTCAICARSGPRTRYSDESLCCKACTQTARQMHDVFMQAIIDPPDERSPGRWKYINQRLKAERDFYAGQQQYAKDCHYEVYGHPGQYPWSERLAVEM